MNNPWVITILGGIIVVVIGLLIEYKYFQNEHLQSRVLYGSKTGWEEATNKAIRQFKRQIGEGIFAWITKKYVIIVDKVEKGKALLSIEVKDKQLGTVDCRYNITIDRTGDILQMEPVKVTLDEKLYSDLFRDFLSLSKQDDHLVSPNSPPKITEIKGPIKKLSSNQIDVYVEFVVENKGPATQIYPYVEFKIARLQGKVFVDEMIRTEPEVIEIEPYVVVRYLRGKIFPTSTIIAIPEQKPRVELFQPPIKTGNVGKIC